MEINDKILQRAVDTWGKNSQIEMVKEECLELALAIQKSQRTHNDEERVKRYYDIIDEIADVTIMIKQAEKIFPKELIDARIKFKMDRLEQRLDKHDNGSSKQKIS